MGAGQGAVAFFGGTADVLLNVNSGEFSLYGTIEGGVLAGVAASVNFGWFAVRNLPSNAAYSGPVFAHGLTAGIDLSSAYEQFWSAPMSIDQNWSQKPNGSAFTVGLGEGLGLYRSLGYGYESYAMDVNGSRAQSPLDVGKAIQEMCVAFRVDIAQTPPLPWQSRK